tara:strand:+ start:351 stop:2702 length:2352 start_codon:yes stop_codon:yes gene_type:complete
MSYIMVRKSLIIKGDGVYAYHGGVPHLLTAPPPEAFGIGPDGIDAPAFAHFGNSAPHESGHPGMGQLIPGEFRSGKYGETAYHDGERNHFHGHDGVWHQIGKALEENNLLGKEHPELGVLTPENILQRAIDDHNMKHHTENNFHELPDVNSPEWRKIHSAGWTGKNPSKRPNRNSESNLITTFTNRGEERAKIGHFVESYSVPYNQELQEIMLRTLGLQQYAKEEWLSRNYISIDDLDDTGRYGKRFKGYGGSKPGDKGEIPDDHMDERHNAAHQRIQSWEVAHHLPDMFHYKLSRQPTEPATQSAMQHIDMALRSIDPNKIPDVMVPVNTTQTTMDGQGTSYSMQPLRTVLRDPKSLGNLVTELAKTPAFHFMFGRVGSGGERATPPKRMFQHLLEQFGGDNFSDARTHVVAGPHMKMSPANPYGQKALTSGKGTHKSAAQFFTKVMLAGPHEEGPSAMRHYQPDEDVLRSLGVDPASAKTADARRQGLEAIADLISESQGHQTRRPVPEEIPTGALFSRLVQGYPQPDSLIERLPPHIPFSTDLSMPPKASGPPRERTTTTPSAAPSPPREASSPPLAITQRPPTRAAPSPQTRLDDPRFARVQRPLTMQQEFQRRLARGPNRAQPPELVQVRRDVGGMDPQQLRAYMASTGLGPTPGVGELTPREQQFQQAFGDPRQQLIEQYLRSLDETLPEADRLLKAMETMQRDDAMSDEVVMKHALTRPVNIADNHGISHLAKMVGLTPLDVRSIAHQTGDWNRIAKRLNVSDNVVKVIKVSIGGV